MRDWTEIEGALAAGQPSMRGLPGRDAFWSEFDRRARGRTRDEFPRTSPARWAAAVATGALVVAGGILLSLRAARAQAGNVINELEVEAAHRAVLIMNDASNRSTILWIVSGAEMKPEEQGGGM